MKVQGKIYLINDTQQISEKFKKREFVLELTSNPAYVQKVIFTLIFDNVDLINDFSKGDNVEVDYDLKGKEWTSPKGEVKFFNTLEASEVIKLNSGGQAAENQDELKARVPSKEEDDDLPF